MLTTWIYLNHHTSMQVPGYDYHTRMKLYTYIPQTNEENRVWGCSGTFQSHLNCSISWTIPGKETSAEPFCWRCDHNLVLIKIFKLFHNLNLGHSVVMVKHITFHSWLVPHKCISAQLFWKVAIKRYPSDIFIYWNKRMGHRATKVNMRHMLTTLLFYLITCPSKYVVGIVMCCSGAWKRLTIQIP